MRKEEGSGSSVSPSCSPARFARAAAAHLDSLSSVSSALGPGISPFVWFQKKKAVVGV